MSQTAKIHPCADGPFELTSGYMIWCPGCRCSHLFNVDPSKGRPTWSFDGNLEAPTFSPSMLVTQPGWPKLGADEWVVYHIDGNRSLRIPKMTLGDCEPTVAAIAARFGLEPKSEAVGAWVREVLDSLKPEVCHSFVRNGFIEFLTDSTHEFAGKTVALEEF